MTVYVSQYVLTGELSRGTTATPPVRSDAVDQPLLTHVWRMVFEQQARKCERR